MAIGRLSIKVGKAGKAGQHAAYIARSGEYASRLGRGERLEASEAGNLPAWAAADPSVFWQAADAHERKNGTTYREMEIALPRELSAEQRATLVRGFVCQEIGDRHAYQWAIHTPRAADGGEQPHAHLMFSERQRDGIERDPEQYFKRYQAKAPEQGGARKGWGERAGQTLSREERAADLKALRQRWAQACNAALEQAGRAERIEMRSHADRGTGLAPEAKQLPSQWRGPGRAAVIEFRQARRELAEAQAALGRAVPDANGELARLEAERERPIGRARPGPAVQSARFRGTSEEAADSVRVSLNLPLVSKPIPPERPLEADQSRKRRESVLLESFERNRASGRSVGVLRPWSVAAVAADLGKIDRNAPIEQQVLAFLKVGDDLAHWRSRKASHACKLASERYWRRYRRLIDAQAAHRQAKPAGLLGVFKQKAYEAAGKAYQQADALHNQALALAGKLEAVAGEEAVKAWTWRRLAEAAPDLVELVKAYRQAERLAQSQARQAAQKARERGGRAGPRR